MARASSGLAALLVALLAGWGGEAQEPGAPARLDAGASRLEAANGGLMLSLSLSGPVPWRLHTLDAPRRLVVEFAALDWGADGRALGGGAAFGAGPPGWSRLVVPLPAPLEVAEAGMAVEEASGAARLLVRLLPASAEAFAAAARPEADPPPPPDAGEGPLVVAIDPGHGGRDPGAERAGAREADLMLALGVELAAAVARAGMVPVLTRDADAFVPLGARVSAARGGGADVLVSLHADALEGDRAAGASVYTLSPEALDRASERMVERHEGGDLIAGLDLSGHDDAVAAALMDLARAGTEPRSEALAAAVVDALRGAGAPLNSRPLREAPLAVLGAADIPSVLVEAGFLSDEGDRARLSSPEGRAPVVAGLVAALLAWAEADRAGAERRAR